MLAEVVNRENVRVIQSARRPRFLLEALDAIRLVAHSGRKDLHRNVATENFVTRAVNDTHSARADLRHDAVVRESLSNQGIHRAPMVSRDREGAGDSMPANRPSLRH